MADDSNAVELMARLLSEVDGAMKGDAGWNFLRPPAQDRYRRYARAIIRERQEDQMPKLDIQAIRDRYKHYRTPADTTCVADVLDLLAEVERLRAVLVWPDVRPSRSDSP